MTNTGTAGTDTYDIFILSGPDWTEWTFEFVASNGITPLTDTDGDNIKDTGPVPQGATITILARFRPSAGAQVGEAARLGSMPPSPQCLRRQTTKPVHGDSCRICPGLPGPC